MSLFPAYGGDQEANKDIKDATSWLDNPSFPTCSTMLTTQNSADSSGDEQSAKKSKHSKKKKKRKKRHHSKISSETEERVTKKLNVSEILEGIKDDNGESVAFLEIKGTEHYQEEQKIKKEFRPRYNCPCKSMPGVKEAKFHKERKKKPRRYFSKKWQNLADDEQTGQELTKSVEQLNKAVNEDPNEISNWIKLVSFQDDYFKYQAIKYKSTEERDRAVISQKLTILERALSTNVGSEVLIKIWMSLALDHYTFDEVNSKVKQMLNEGHDSMTLILGSVMLTQQSMPKCNVNSVLKCYIDAQETLQRSKRLPGSCQDNYILEIFLYSCTFLEQCGLWESAWAAIKMMIGLNLSMNIPSLEDSETIVIEEENRIIESGRGVPVWNLWKQLETLRQGCHFLPIDWSPHFPQRMGLANMVTDLVHHVRRTTTLRMFCLFLLLAKVPFLPRSHSLFMSISSQHPSWAFDSVENHLAACFQRSPIQSVNFELFAHHIPSDHPPQYLRRLPGQLLFLNFVTKMFEMIMAATDGRSRVIIGVWYLRFLRWLDFLNRLGRYEPPNGRPRTKSIFKEFLKREENRDTTQFYVEFALWEYENGDFNSAIRTLQTLADSRGEVLSQRDNLVKTDLCYLYRILCEVQISSGHKEEAMATLIRLTGAATEAIAGLKLKQIAVEALANETVDCFQMCLPVPAIDWVACFVHFLTLKGLVDEAVDFVEAAALRFCGFMRESLYELLVIISKNRKGNLSHLHRAINQFPLNGLFCAVMAEHLVEGGGLWWKESYHLLHQPSTMSAVALACAVLERNRKHGSQDSRCRTLLKTLTAHEGKTSPILQRMYLQLLSSIGDLPAIEAARVLALEACPWNKNLYMDIIALCPDQLWPLTDLMVEKDFRIHITPDEIDAMRD